MGRSVAALLPPRAAAPFSLVAPYRVEPPAASLSLCAQVQCTATDQEKRAVAGECMILQLAKLATHALAFARRSGRTRATNGGGGDRSTCCCAVMATAGAGGG